jgi:hypothetical protein
MALSSGVFTVGTATPTALNGVSANPVKMHIANNDATDTVYIGGSNVTVATGYNLANKERVMFELNPGEQLFAIASKNNHEISYIAQKS